MLTPSATAAPPRVTALGLAALTTLVLTCAPRRAAGPGLAGPLECALFSPPAERPDTLVIALPERVDPVGAPTPANYSESVLFRHLYETLLRLDCEGRAQLGLAESWRAEKGGRVWRFELRRDARFWDGLPVTATDVLAVWSGADVRATLAAAGIDSVLVESDRVLHVHLSQAQAAAPGVLARPELAVARETDRTPWPMGSASYRIGSITPGPSGVRALALVPVGTDSDRTPVLTFRSAAGRDARDQLEEGIDLVVTSDPAVIDYGTKRSGYKTLPLPWDRSYLLLSTTRVRELRAGEGVGQPLAEALPSELSSALARDAVRGDARGHRPPGWWDEAGGCRTTDATVGLPVVPAGAYRTSGARRIVYPEGDVVARDLAERIVALASAGPASSSARALAAAVPGLFDGGALLAVGLGQQDYETTLRVGDDFAYLLGTPQRAFDRCQELSELSRRAEWLAVGQIDLAAALIPLVDTRRYIIARPERLALSLDWGAMVYVPPFATARR